MRLIGALVGFALAACSPAEPSAEPAFDGAGSPPGLAEPSVIMQADPPPPYTYWAPEGSTIISHPNGEPVWIAQSPGGERLAFYFGDACGAAQRQGWIGRPRTDLPDLVSSETVRIVEWGQGMHQDLRYNRLNVLLDDQGRIREVACH